MSAKAGQYSSNVLLYLYLSTDNSHEVKSDESGTDTVTVISFADADAENASEQSKNSKVFFIIDLRWLSNIFLSKYIYILPAKVAGLLFKEESIGGC